MVSVDFTKVHITYRSIGQSLLDNCKNIYTTMNIALF